MQYLSSEYLIWLLRNSYKETNTAYRDFKNKWTNIKQVNRNINNIEITLDNICDMACVYCDATSSSRIAQELGHKKVMNVPDPAHMETFIDWFEKVAAQSMSNLLAIIYFSKQCDPDEVILVKYSLRSSLIKSSSKIHQPKSSSKVIIKSHWDEFTLICILMHQKEDFKKSKIY